MRSHARALLALLAILGGVDALAADLTTDAALPRIVVAFSNPAHAAPGPAGATGARYGGAAYQTGQSARRQASQVAADYGLREITSWPIQLLTMHCVVFEVTGGRSAAEVLARLANDPRVTLAQPLQQFHTLTSAAYNDPLYDLQTNLPVLGIARAHLRSQGAGVHIALIDTAVDAAHPDLSGRIVRTHSFLGERPTGSLSSRHGTAMAGVIAAVANNSVGIVGIAPLARVEVFEACWQLAPSSDAAACNTFTLARALAAALASNAPLVNLSIGGPADPLLAALVAAGVKRGVTFVGAAADTSSPFPTALPGVITAGGLQGALPPGALAAPAQHVLTTLPNAQYDFESGTSVSAAEITGVIALLMSASHTRLDSADILALLHQNASGLRTAAPAPVDVNAALDRLGSDAVRVARAPGAH
jgi:subtilisin family serine protease